MNYFRDMENFQAGQNIMQRKVSQAVSHAQQIESTLGNATRTLASQKQDLITELDATIVLSNALVMELARVDPDNPLVSPVRNNPRRQAIFENAKAESLARLNGDEQQHSA